MMKKTVSLWACLCCFFVAAISAAQQIPPAVIADPAPDRANPASMEAPDIPSHGSRLHAVFYLASGAGPHPTVLLLHGFPGNEKNMDLLYSIRRAGWNVLFPHYRGAWGSEGTFSFTHAIEDTQAAVEFLRDPDNVKRYRINPRQIVLIGHSMGGFMAAYATAHDPAISAVVMIAAWNIGPDVSHQREKQAELFQESSPRLAGTTPEGLLAEAKQNAARWNFVDYAPALKTRPALIIEAEDGLAAESQALAAALLVAGDTHVTELHLATDHSFSDRRIALQSAVVDWLDRLYGLTTK